MPLLQTQQVQIKGRDEAAFATLTSDGAKQRVDVSALLVGALVPTDYDAISLSYTSTNLTGVAYYVGGLAGSLVATLTLGYSGANLTSVVRT